MDNCELSQTCPLRCGLLRLRLVSATTLVTRLFLRSRSPSSVTRRSSSRVLTRLQRRLVFSLRSTGIYAGSRQTSRMFGRSSGHLYHHSPRDHQHHPELHPTLTTSTTTLTTSNTTTTPTTTSATHICLLMPVWRGIWQTALTR